MLHPLAHRHLHGLKQMEPITHKYLRSLLSEGKIVTFTFTKKDGTDRTIRATTNISLIPKDKKPKFVKTAPVEQICVFDLEKEEWRSLQADTKILLENVRTPNTKDLCHA